MSAQDRPTAEYLRQCFHYEDGRLYWRKRPASHFKAVQISAAWNARFAGKEAGWISVGRGMKRCKVGINGKFYYRSLIVWTLHENAWPNKLCDHKDRNSLNDRIENLREATSSQNGANTRINIVNTSGYKWVNFRPDCKRKYRSRILVNKKRITCGFFDTPEEAYEAAKAEHQRQFGEFTCDG